MTRPRPAFAVIFAVTALAAAPAAAQWDPTWHAPPPDYAAPVGIQEPLEDPPNLGMRPRAALSLGAGATGVHVRSWSPEYDYSQYRPTGRVRRRNNEYVSDPSFAGALSLQLPLHRLFSLDARVGLTTWAMERHTGILGRSAESGLFWDLGLATTFRIPTRETVEWRLSAIFGLSGNRWSIDTEYETGTNRGIGFHVGGSFGVQHMFSRHIGWSFDTVCIYRLVAHEEWVLDEQLGVEFEAVSLSMQVGLVVRL